MDIQQIEAMMAQYWQDGKDIQALLNDYTALKAAGKTPLGLNQWVKSDKPLMEDFNEDNRIVDAKLRELQEGKADISLEEALHELEARAAAAESPAEHALPLAEGIAQRARGQCNYSKDSSGRVYVKFCVEASPFADTISKQTIAVLPAGFRPQARTISSCSGHNSGVNGSLSAAGFLDVQTNGDVIVQFNPKMATAYGEISFLAAR